jgi:flagellar biosynthesis/type III secretory pathway M-ring protein FliF/YscJ
MRSLAAVNGPALPSPSLLPVEEEDAQLEYDSEGRPIALDGPTALEPKALTRQQQTYDQQLAHARGMVSEDPARVAQVLRTWVTADAG